MAKYLYYTDIPIYDQNAIFQINKNMHPNGILLIDSKYANNLNLLCYEIELNFAKILHLSKISDYANFCEKYCQKISQGNYTIKWNQVYKNYSGISIDNYENIFKKISINNMFDNIKTVFGHFNKSCIYIWSNQAIENIRQKQEN